LNLFFNSTNQEIEGHGKISSLFKQKKADLLALLANLPYVSHFANENSFIITLPDSVPVLFELNNQADLLFAIELGMGQLLAEKIEKAEDLKLLVGDQYPDSFAVVFSSLRTLRQSDQYKQDTARTFLMIQVNNLIERVSKSYNHRLSSQVLLLGSPRSCPFAQLSKLLPAQINKDELPYVFVSEKNYERDCQDLTQALEATDFEVHCLHPHLSHLRIRQVSGNDNSDNNLLLFQSIFWGTIGWIITIILIVYAMSGINGGKDTMLYRSSVQSRHAHAQ